MKIKKITAILLTVLLLLLATVPAASAAEAKSNEMTPEEIESANWKALDYLAFYDYFVHQNNCPDTDNYNNDHKWYPAQYNFDGAVTEDNAAAILDYAAYIFESELDYEKWQEFYDSHMVVINDRAHLKFTEEEMLSILNKTFVFKNLKAEDFPSFDKTTRTFTTNYTDGLGGIDLCDYNTTKKDNGNYVVEIDCSKCGSSFTRSSWNLFTVEFTSDFKVVYANIDDMVLESAEWKTKPDVTEYKYGEPLKLDGASFTAKSKYVPKYDPEYGYEMTVDDSSSWEVKVTPDMVTGYSPEKTGKQTLTVNYYNKSLTFDVTVLPKEEAEKVVVENKDTGAKLETEKDVIPEDTQLIVKPVTEGGNFKIINNALEQTSDKWVAYDISLESKGVEIQPNGTVKITMPRPSGLNMNKMALYHIAEDGTKTLIPFTLDENNKNIIFETDHFSLYVFAEKKDGAEINVEIPDTENSGSSWALIVTGIMLLAGAGCVLPVIKKKKYN